MSVYRCNRQCAYRRAFTRYRNPWYVNLRVLGLFHIGIGTAVFGRITDGSRP